MEVPQDVPEVRHDAAEVAEVRHSAGEEAAREEDRGKTDGRRAEEVEQAVAAECLIMIFSTPWMFEMYLFRLRGRAASRRAANLFKDMAMKKRRKK